jgi:hypothetical protein
MISLGYSCHPSLIFCKIKNQNLQKHFFNLLINNTARMAKNKSVVLLGYEDELVEKHKHFIDFSTNKIGGEAVS